MTSQQVLKNPEFTLTAPVAMIVRNRPDLTSQVMEAIRQARPARLFIVAEPPNPAKPGDMEFCNQARAAAERIDWNCQVAKASSNSYGPYGRFLMEGMNWVFSQVPEAIILEDDCKPSISFFAYSQEMLKKYRLNRNVMHIGGNPFAASSGGEGSYRFSRFPNMCGCAVWRRAWRLFDTNLPTWPMRKAKNWLADELKLDAASVRVWTNAFDAAIAGQNECWPWAWAFACMAGGLSVHPNATLVERLAGRENEGNLLKICPGPVLKGNFEIRHPYKAALDVSGEPVRAEAIAAAATHPRQTAGIESVSRRENIPAETQSVEPVPPTFSIETSLACNLRCPECAIGGGMVDRKKGFMSFQQYLHIADKIRPFAKYVYLHIWGEPMLNPEIIQMVRHASQFARTNISTNGLMLDDRRIDDLITSGVSDILVSIDGVSQEVYEKYRVGGDVAKALAVLKGLNESNQRHGGKVKITPQFIVFKHNQHEIDKFRDYCKSLGLEAFFKSPYIRDEDGRVQFSDMKQYVRPHYQTIGQLREAMKACPNMTDVFTILLDGSVVACCHDYAGTMCFGNIFRQGVPEIWNDPRYTAFRRAVRSGNAPDFCVEECMVYFPDKSLRKKHMAVKSSSPSSAQPVQSAGPATPAVKVNLCSGTLKLPGYVNVDIMPGSDVILDLEQNLLPFDTGSIDVLVCMSAINYFTRQRAGQIIKDVYRVLKPGGITRFGTQDLRVLAGKYVNQDREFFFQKLADGRERFPGRTMGDKLNEWFYGFQSCGKNCKYVYDYDSLKVLFEEAGFMTVDNKPFRQSRLADVGSIDNRPEQMFFLEAVKPGGLPAQPTGTQTSKVAPAVQPPPQDDAPPPPAGDARAVRDYAIALWNRGRCDKSWQYISEAIELDPNDQTTVDFCSRILKDLNRHDDLIKLYSCCQTANPSDGNVARFLQEAQAAKAASAPSSSDLAANRASLNELDSQLNSVLSDRDHLWACLGWLKRAQLVSGRGGVAAVYHMDESKWDADYPETTGYIIATFLAAARLTGDDSLMRIARQMGDWECEIQTREGGIGEPVGVLGMKPRVFNTGQVLLGLVSLVRQTGMQHYLNAARKAGDWIVSCQDGDGKWTRSTYQGPRAYKSRVAWALMELHNVTGEARYLESARRAVDWTLKQANENGWFNNNSLTDPGKPWTHLTGYVLVGLLECWRLDRQMAGRDNLIKLLHKAAGHICRTYDQTKKSAGRGSFRTLPATLDCNWSSTDDWSCVTGCAQTEFFLRRLAVATGDKSLLAAADMLMDDVKQLQIIDGIDDPDVLGGLPGAYPVRSNYVNFGIPNWGVKFFADCLIQRMNPELSTDCLG